MLYPMEVKVKIVMLENEVRLGSVQSHMLEGLDRLHDQFIRQSGKLCGNDLVALSLGLVLKPD